MHDLRRLRDAAETLGVSYETARRWCASGRLVAYQPAGAGGAWVVDMTRSCSATRQKRSEPPALARKTAQIIS